MVDLLTVNINRHHKLKNENDACAFYLTISLLYLFPYKNVQNALIITNYDDYWVINTVLYCCFRYIVLKELSRAGFKDLST